MKAWNVAKRPEETRTLQDNRERPNLLNQQQIKYGPHAATWPARDAYAARQDKRQDNRPAMLTHVRDDRARRMQNRAYRCRRLKPVRAIIFRPPLPAPCRHCLGHQSTSGIPSPALAGIL